MRIVMVDKFPPLPAVDGGKLRSAALLRRLAARAEIVVCTFADGAFEADAFRELGAEIRTVPLRRSALELASGLARARTASAARFWDARLAEAVRQATEEEPTDVLLVEHGQLAPYLGLGEAGTRVLDLHNVDSYLAHSYANGSRSPAARLAAVEAVLLRRLERRAAASADVVVTVSQEEAQRLPRRPRELLVCPNGCELPPAVERAREPVVAFTALFGWRPNVEAAVWFVRRVWPLVRGRCPAARLLLVGKDPAPGVTALRSESVEVTGTVEDVLPYLARARVAVAPLLSGGGTRLKILEALAAGRPVVATRVAADGLGDLVGQGVSCADTPEELADETAGLLLDPERAVRTGAAGRAAVAERYSWDAVLAPLLERLTA